MWYLDIACQNVIYGVDVNVDEIIQLVLNVDCKVNKFAINDYVFDVDKLRKVLR